MEYDPGLELFGYQIIDPSININPVFPIIKGHFMTITDNKYNMINTIAHEYKHVLDFLRIRSLINYGFNYYKISQYSDKNRELRAIEYQRSHNSYNNTTTKYKKTIDRYESIQK